MGKEKKYHIGIDLGGTNIAVGIVKDLKVIQKHSVKTNSQRPANEVLDDMAEAIKVTVAMANITIDECFSIGIGSPGNFDSKTGTIIYANNLNWENVGVRTHLEKHFDIPIYINNDANCAGFGEALAGAAKGAVNAILLTLGTGVGGGIIIDSKIYSGHNDAGGEVGHSLLVLDGELCTCGRYGCLEAYASATGLIRQTRVAMDEHPSSLMHEEAEKEGRVTGRTAFEAAKRGDKPGIDVVNQYVKYLSEGIIDFINIFRPEQFIIGGGISHEGDYLFDKVNEYVSTKTYAADLVPPPKIIPAILGNDAGIIGAALLDS